MKCSDLLTEYQKDVNVTLTKRLRDYPYDQATFPAELTATLPNRMNASLATLQSEMEALIGPEDVKTKGSIKKLEQFCAQKMIATRARIIAQGAKPTVDALTPNVLYDQIELLILRHTSDYLGKLHTGFHFNVNERMAAHFNAQSDRADPLSRVNVIQACVASFTELDLKHRPAQATFDFAHGKNQARQRLAGYRDRIIRLTEGGEYSLDPVEYMAYEIKRLHHEIELDGDVHAPMRSMDATLITEALQSLAHRLGIDHQVRALLKDTRINWVDYHYEQVLRTRRPPQTDEFLFNSGGKGLAPVDLDICRATMRRLTEDMVAEAEREGRLIGEEANEVRMKMAVIATDFQGHNPNAELNRIEKRYEPTAAKRRVSGMIVDILTAVREHENIPRKRGPEIAF